MPTPEEILAVYGVDVSKLSPTYSTYRIATKNDLWLRDVGANTTAIGDLIIESPDNYRSRIYAYKIPSRHVNLTGPDFYYYIYHPALFTGTLEECVRKYYDELDSQNRMGTLAFIFDDGNSTIELFVSYPGRNVLIKGKSPSAYSSDLNTVLLKWGAKKMVQNYTESVSDTTPLHCGFVGD